MAARLILLLLALWPAALSAQVKKLPSGPAPVMVRELFIRVEEPAMVWRWRAAPEAGLEPTLLRAMRGDAMVALATDRRAARRDMAEAGNGGYPFRRHETLTDWTVTADTARLLVLQGHVWRYTGGAHGNSSYAGRLWDRQARRSIGIETLFTDWPRARRLIEPAYCEALQHERQARRGPTGLAGEFATCPPLAEQLIVPAGALASGAAGQLRVVLPPYVAGPYSEGSYVVQMPWPAGIEALVAPMWKTTLGFGR